MLVKIINFFISKIRPNHKGSYNANSILLLRYYCNKGLIPFLRSYKFKLLGIKCKILFTGKNVVIDFPNNILMGEKNILGDYVRILGSSRSFVIGNRNSIREFAWIQRSSFAHRLGEHFLLGDDNYLGPYLQIGIGGSVIIGSSNFFGNNIQIISENHQILNDKPSMTEVNRVGIKIGNNNWLGNNVIILDGVVIGDNNIIAAGTIVNKSIGSQEVHAGNPNKLIKRL